jgi:hypothetical protein
MFSSAFFMLVFPAMLPKARKAVRWPSETGMMPHRLCRAGESRVAGSAGDGGFLYAARARAKIK